MDRWPHQIRAVQQFKESIQAGERRICLTSPTGGGKSVIASDIITWVVEELKWGAMLCTNRKMLLEQLCGTLDRHGIDYGIRAAGHPRNHHCPVQISSLPTERVRTLKKGTWEPHWKDKPCLMLIDEAHLNANDTAVQLADYYCAREGAVLGITATPADIWHIYTRLIQAGVNSELRACGALVAADHYGCGEPDLAKIKMSKVGEDLSEKDQAKAIMVPHIFGRVLEWFKRLNPFEKPSILFAPGVAHSLWFAEQFYSHGISAAHIDGESAWINGRAYRSDSDVRSDIAAQSKDGRIKVVCNRFVLREGIDWPWLQHGILACVLGSVQTYLQVVGRLLRSSPGKGRAVIQDHGGHWHRPGLGSVNIDRVWKVGDSAAKLAAMAEDRLRDRNPGEPSDKEPWNCPECGRVLMTWRCPCGYVLVGKKKRAVVQADGKLVYHEGDIYKPRRQYQKPDVQDRWQKMYHRARRAGMTFRQAEALFAMENNWAYPPRSLHLMPKNEIDWFRRVRDVPVDQLRQQEVLK